MKACKLDSTHLQERCRWLNHPAVYRYLNMQHPISLEETVRWHERARGNSSRVDLTFTEGDAIASMTGLTSIDTHNGLVEFYIMTNPDLQGRGYGKKATAFTLNYAFSQFNIQKVFLYTNASNERANGMYLKLGFVLEGQLRRHKFKDGTFIDRHIYGLLKEDWQRQPDYRTDIDLEF